MKLLKVLLAALAASLVIPVFAQNEGEYLDLSKDQFVAGGMTSSGIANELLPAFAGYAPKEKADEVISFAFNYDIPKLQLAFRDSKGKVHTRTGKLAKGEKLISTVNSKTRQGGIWLVDATVRWAQHCGNPLPSPFRVTLWIPDWSQDRIVVQRVEILKPYAVTVRENVIVQQLIPTLGNVELNLPPVERGRYKLTVVGNEGAGHRWEYVKSFWDNFLDFLRVAAFPIGQLVRRADNLSINTSSQGGAGGNGYGAAAAAASSSSSSSSTSATPTSAAGTSGSGGSSAGGAAGGGGNDTTGTGSGGMPELVLFFERTWLQVAA
ncbi:MAG: hypothetical protein AAB669_03400 [Patescibacteria group bacterium]